MPTLSPDADICEEERDGGGGIKRVRELIERLKGWSKRARTVLAMLLRLSP